MQWQPSTKYDVPYIRIMRTMSAHIPVAQFTASYFFHCGGTHLRLPTFLVYGHDNIETCWRLAHSYKNAKCMRWNADVTETAGCASALPFERKSLRIEAMLDAREQKSVKSNVSRVNMQFEFHHFRLRSHAAPIKWEIDDSFGVFEMGLGSKPLAGPFFSSYFRGWIRIKN